MKKVLIIMSAFIFISTTHTAHIMPKAQNYKAQMEALENTPEAQQLQKNSGKMRTTPKRRHRPSILLPGVRPNSAEHSPFALSYDTLKSAKKAARIKKIKKTIDSRLTYIEDLHTMIRELGAEIQDLQNRPDYIEQHVYGPSLENDPELQLAYIEDKVNLLEDYHLNLRRARERRIHFGPNAVEEFVADPLEQAAMHLPLPDALDAADFDALLSE